ncbi:MAG: YtxH domain-containing protein [Candidatus Saccharimonadales bacterium]
MRKKDTTSKTTKKLAIGAAIAGAAGYLAGVLTAPKSGKATRDDIKDATQRGISEA